MFELEVKTPPEWAAVALRDFDTFLIDHAACERKASAVGLSFVVRYPDRVELIEPMIQFAREELEHYHQVTKLVLDRGLTLRADEEDQYVNQLMKAVRFGRDERFLDRLLVSAIIEARGCERLMLVGDALQDEKLKNFYHRLARAEGHHKDFFLKIALIYFPEPSVMNRLQELLATESAAIQAAPFRSALH